MSRNFVILSVAVSVAVLVACVAPCSATPINVLANGDFETASASSKLLSAGETADLANWTVSASGSWYIDRNPGSYAPDCAADSGTAKLLAAAGSGYNVTSDPFAVTAGTTYTVSYWTRLRDSTSPTAQSIFAAINAPGGMTLTGTQGNMDSMTGSGTGVLTWAGAGVTPVHIWTNFTATFVPSTSGNVTLSFSNANNGGGFGFVLDNASVTGDTSTPEPGTLALLAAGLAGLLCYAWRKRR